MKDKILLENPFDSYWCFVFFFFGLRKKNLDHLGSESGSGLDVTSFKGGSTTYHPWFSGEQPIHHQVVKPGRIKRPLSFENSDK